MHTTTTKKQQKQYLLQPAMCGAQIEQLLLFCREVGLQPLVVAAPARCLQLDKLSTKIIYKDVCNRTLSTKIDS